MASKQVAVPRPTGSSDDQANGWQAWSWLPEFSLIAGFLVLLWFGIGVTIQYEYDQARSSAARVTENLARAFEESTRRTIGEVDITLMSLRGARAALGDRFNFDEWVRTQALPDWIRVQIGMADARGEVTANTIPIPPGGANVFDRAHFQAQIDPTHDDLYISKPVHGRVSNKDTIQFTRKLIGPHGEFAGIVAVSLGCDELSRFYQTLDIGKGVVALVSSDGVVLAVGPMMPHVIGTSIADDPLFAETARERKGLGEFGARWDGIDRIVSFRRMPDRPLTVMVGVDNNTAFAQYRHLREQFLWTGAAATGMVGLVGLFWLNQRRRSMASRRALMVTLEAISQGILMIDRKGRIPVINRRAADLLRLPFDPPRLASRGAMKELLRRTADSTLSRQIDAHLGHDEDRRGQAPDRFEVRRDDGIIVEIIRHFPPRGGVVETYTDVTEQRFAEARTRYAANHDYITGLPNRLKLRECLEGMLPRRSVAGHGSAFIMIDLDGFKGVNDTFGHDVGDTLLVEIARRLQQLVEEDDIASRIGGDEFVIVKSNVKDDAEAMEFSDRVLRRIAAPFETSGHQLRVGASIGIAFHPKDGHDTQTLFKHADIALYRAKADGRGIVRRYDEEMSRLIEERRLLESDLRQALENDGIEVWFQPQFACDSLRLVGFEALARWNHPTRGFVSPAVFIPLAETSGLIIQLGKRILERSCAQAATWPEDVRVAVNLSPIQFNDADIRRDVRDILDRTGLAPSRLELEVTESLLASDERAVRNVLKFFRSLGVQIALDDFGTGYSSLSYLRKFPFDAVKIDRSFVQAQSTDDGVRAITEAILVMCEHLGLRVVAEGVESPGQLALLRQQKCAMVQGFLLGKPVPEADLADFPWDGRPAVGPAGHETARGLETVH